MGSRKLNQREIELINKIKLLGEQTKAVLQEVHELHIAEVKAFNGSIIDHPEHMRLQSEGFRNRSLANDDLQLGLMRLVRAVDRRTTFC